MSTRRLCPLLPVGNQGFTLIELMVAIAMGIFFITVTFFIIDSSSRSYRAQERVSQVQQDVRAAVDFMAREIRMAGYDPMGLSGAGVGIDTDATTFQFSMDIDRSNSLDTGQFEQITYAYDDPNDRLIRQYPEAGGGPHTDVLIENVSALNFTYVYYDGSAAAAAGALDEIGTVIVTLTCQDRDAKGGTFARTLTSTIKLRNFGLY